MIVAATSVQICEGEKNDRDVAVGVLDQPEQGDGATPFLFDQRDGFDLRRPRDSRLGKSKNGRQQDQDDGAGQKPHICPVEKLDVANIDG